MKLTILSIVIAGSLIVGAIIFSRDSSVESSYTNNTQTNNVSIVDGKQIIEINAKGGYQPKSSFAKANMPTILRFKTGGTFDCSLSVRIPSLKISQILPQNGIIDIDIGVQSARILKGSCSMGMYRFDVKFQ